MQCLFLRIVVFNSKSTHNVWSQVNSSLGYNILIGLGYLFIGLSVITLLGANWDEIPRALRMIGLITLTMGTQAFAIKKYMKITKNIRNCKCSGREDFSKP